jgi:hypothetical protein
MGQCPLPSIIIVLTITDLKSEKVLAVGFISLKVTLTSLQGTAGCRGCFCGGLKSAGHLTCGSLRSQNPNSVPAFWSAVGMLPLVLFFL